MHKYTVSIEESDARNSASWQSKVRKIARVD